MKLSALHQSYLNRRNNSFRSSSSPADPSLEVSGKSPTAVFWLVLHGLCCLISLVLGFRFSRLVFFFLFSTSSTTTTNLFAVPFRSDLQANFAPVSMLNATTAVRSSRVVVGRHGIRIRPWPHPNPVEIMKAHQLMERVQREQRMIFGVKNPRTVIAVTPTYVRTFQALHLTGVMHSLMLVPYDLVWIVVEAGGATNETASIIAKSGLRTIHVGFNQRMPNTWKDRSKLEAQMRLRALRVVSEEKLDGVVMFADDSNMHSMELFDEIQNVKWFGAISVGILAHSGDADELLSSMDHKKEQQEKASMPIQGPACNASDKLVGWHIFDTLPYAGKGAVFIDDLKTVLPQRLEWAGFTLNSRLLWKATENKPDWAKEFDTLDENEDLESPLTLLKDPSMVEPLGNCGKQVLLWWLRAEARADSKFPPGWIINPPLEMTVAAKRTPWPDTPPELPSRIKATTSTQENATSAKHTTKTRKSKRRSKRKHELKTADSQDSSKHSDSKLRLNP